MITGQGISARIKGFSSELAKLTSKFDSRWKLFVPLISELLESNLMDEGGGRSCSTEVISLERSVVSSLFLIDRYASSSPFSSSPASLSSSSSSMSANAFTAAIAIGSITPATCAFAINASSSSSPLLLLPLLSLSLSCPSPPPSSLLLKPLLSLSLSSQSPPEKLASTSKFNLVNKRWH